MGIIIILKACFSVSLILFSSLPTCLSIKGCLFEYNGICSLCRPGYILTINNQQCVSQDSSLINCIRMDQQRKCRDCDCGYGLASNNTCINNSNPSLILNCASYDAELKCLRCKSIIHSDIDPFDFALSFDFKQCLINDKKVPNCFQYESDEITCIKCADDYYLNPATKQCQKLSIKNCQQETANSVTKEIQCMICSNGYSMDKTQKSCFLTNLQNCIILVNSFECELCETGYQLNPMKKQCIQNQYANCIELNFDLATPVCSQCEGPGIALNKEGVCVTSQLVNPDNCQVYQSENVCLSCYPTYTLSWDGKFCFQEKIPGCLKGSYNEQFCLLCDSSLGYVAIFQEYYDSSQWATNCVQFEKLPLLSTSCIEAFNEVLCRKCKAGYFLGFDGGCHNIEKTNCYYGESERYCHVCLEGYVVVNGYCYLQQNPEILNSQIQAIINDQNCIELDIVNMRCLICKPGFSNNQYEPSCQVQIQIEPGKSSQIDLKDENGQIVDIRCIIGSFRVNNKCVSNTFLDNCRSDFPLQTRREFNYNCYSNCDIGYDSNANHKCKRLFSRGCVQSFYNIPNCDLCSYNGSDDYGYDKGLQTCILNSIFSFQIQFCLNYEISIQECTQCRPGHLEVRDPTTNKIKQCKSPIDSCLLIASNGKCTKCKENYIITVQSKCQPFSTNLLGCLIAENDGLQCNLCIQDFDVYHYTKDLSTGLCVELSKSLPFCVEYDPSDPSACIKCQEGRTEPGCSLISTYLPYCSTYFQNQDDLNFYCQSCTAFRMLVGTNCLPKIENCDSYSGDMQSCQVCRQLYFTSPDKKQCLPLNVPNAFIYKCQTFDLSSCNECFKGYQKDPITNLCVIDDPNCEILQNNNCDQCQQGFSKNQNGVCMTQIVNCTNYNILGNCIQCKKGTALKTDLTQCSDAAVHFQCLRYANDLGCIESACDTGYFVREAKISTVCQLVMADCLEIDEYGNCLQCSAGKILNSLKIKCLIPTINACSEYINELLCGQCNSGYVLSDNNQKCLQIIPGCSILSQEQEGVCLQCQTKMGIVDQSMEKLTCLLNYNDGSPEKPYFCAEYQKNSKTGKVECIQCASGFVLTNTKSLCIFSGHVCGGVSCYQYQEFYGYDTQRVCIGEPKTEDEIAIDIQEPETSDISLPDVSSILSNSSMISSGITDITPSNQTSSTETKATYLLNSNFMIIICMVYALIC